MNKIFFCKLKGPYGCFSNFSSHPIYLDESVWPTSEHYFQAQKFENYKDRSEVMMAKSPMEAAIKGRDRTRPLRLDWEQIKDDVMKKCVKAKVMQHEDVRKLLLSIPDTEIIEHTARDSYWGDGGNGTGKNILGKILMEIRDDLLKIQG